MADLREQILAAKDISSEMLHVDAWGVDVEIRGMSGRARAAIMQRALSGSTVDLGKMYPLMVIECTFDPETGKRVFTEADFEAVGDKNGVALEQIAAVAARLSGLDADAVERSKSEVEV